MTSLQYVIDTICASVTGECVYKMIDALLSQGAFKIPELIPLIQSKDRSLDSTSARLIADAALENMVQRGVIRIEGDDVSSAK
jgi:hypothetical protein